MRAPHANNANSEPIQTVAARSICDHSHLFGRVA